MADAAPPDPGAMMADTDFFDLLERVAEEAPGGRAIPLRVGASMRCEEYGAFGLAFKSAVDLEGSYRRVERYGRVVTSVANFRLVPMERATFFEVIPGTPDRRGLRLTHELALGAATALSREVGTEGFTPVAVHLSLPVPVDRSVRDAFEQVFGCPILFDTGRDALEVSQERLAQPNRLGDVSFSRFFDTHLDQALAELPEDDLLARRVRAEVAQALSEGVPTLAQMAKRLGMSRRTLQRRLADAGVAYQDLVTEARRDLVERLLRTTEYGLAEVAFLAGFSDQSTFSRAFKRWCNQTPRGYRQAHSRSPI